MFGERLKQLRTEKGLYQKELAKILGVSSGAIGMYENGKRTPDFELLRKIADYFNVSLDYLLGRTDERNPEKRKIYSGDELAELLPEPYKTLFKKQNLGYVKFAKELAKHEIDIDKLIKLIEITENIRLEVENENNEDNS